MLFWKVDKLQSDSNDAGSKPEIKAEIAGQIVHPHQQQGRYFTSVQYRSACCDGRADLSAAAVALDDAGNLTLWPGGHNSRQSVELASGETEYTAVAFAPSGNFVAGASSSTVTIWGSSHDGFAVRKTWQAHAAAVSGMHFGVSDSCLLLLSSSAEAGEIRVWDAESWECQQTVDLRDNSYDRTALVAGGEFFLVASSKSPSLLAFHLGEQGVLDYVTACKLGQPVLSFTAHMDAAAVGIFGVQASAIQQFTLQVEQCRPPHRSVADAGECHTPTMANDGAGTAPVGTESSRGNRDAATDAAMHAAARSDHRAVHGQTAHDASTNDQILQAIGRLGADVQSMQGAMAAAVASVSSRVEGEFQQLAATQVDVQLKQRAEHDRFCEQFKSQVHDALPRVLAPVLRQELHAAVSALETALAKQIDDTLGRVVAASVEKSTRASVERCVTSESSGLTAAVIGGLQEPIRDALRATVVNALLPAVETSLQLAFVTVNTTIENGLTTCLKEPVESSLQYLRDAATNAAPTEVAASVTEPDPKAVIEALIEVRHVSKCAAGPGLR